MTGRLFRGAVYVGSMEQWSSRFGFILAAIGAAVGLGNIWRFSSVVGQNGGGAYLVPYCIAFFVFALPLLILEVWVGRKLEADVATAFQTVRERFAVFGWLIAGIVVVILAYYLVIAGWTLAFFVHSLVGGGLTFAAFTASWEPVLFFLLAACITGGVLLGGVRAGIERVASVLIPLIFLILAGLVVYVSRLDGFGEGVRFLFTPDFSVLTDPLIWAAAFGQAFFSLSAGQGIMLTYGSYLGERVNVVRASVLIAVMDILAAFLAGITIFALVATFGLSPSAGAELAFTTLPQAFAAMPFGGGVAAAFFGLLFAAALTSAVAMMEVGVAPLVRRGWSRKRVVTGMTAAIIILGLPAALSYAPPALDVMGVRVLDLMDETVGTIGLPLAGLLIAIVFTRFLDLSDLGRVRGGRTVLFLTTYLLPVVLAAIIVLRVLFNVSPRSWTVTVVMDGLPTGPVTALAAIIAVVVGQAVLERLGALERHRA